MLLSLKISGFFGDERSAGKCRKMSTRGYEFDLNWSDHSREWKYGASLNFSDCHFSYGRSA